MIGTGSQNAIAVTLDIIESLCRTHFSGAGQKAVVKIDVEGHELSVLKGSTNFIRKFRPYIIFESIEDVEVEGRRVSTDCKSLLVDLDYCLFLQYERVLVPRGPEDMQDGLVSDFLAVPREAINMVSSLEVRDLTRSERLEIVARDAAEASPRHQAHAAAAGALIDAL